MAEIFKRSDDPKPLFPPNAGSTVLETVRAMDDNAMWHYLRSLVRAANKHYPIREGPPIDLESGIILEHHFKR